ncbi:MAG: AI-2E family transporter [Hyphomicrobiaceae bacterium]
MSDLTDAVFIRRLLLTALVVALIVAAWLLSPLLLLAFGSVLIAMALRSLARPFERIGLSETWSIVLTTLLIVAGLVAAIVFFGTEMASQWQALDARLSTLLSDASKALGVNSLEELLTGSGAKGGIATMLPRFLSWGASVGQAVLGASVMLVGGVYLATDSKSYREGVLKLIPKDYRANAIATLEDIGEALHRWLGGVLVAMVLVGLMTGFGLWIAGVQSPLALGLLAGLANAVPYIGSIMAAVVTTAIAAGQSWQAMLGALVVMIIVQQVEGNLITPLVVGRAVSIPPATGLFAIVAMGMLFGPLGVLLGFPLSIVIDIAVRRLYIRDVLDEPVEILGDAAKRSDEAVASEGKTG